MSVIAIRRGVSPRDDEVARGLVAAYFADGPAPLPPHVAPYLAEFPRQLVGYVLAWDRDTAVGFAGLRDMEPGVAEVKRLYVVPSHRRRGVARALMAGVEAEARRLGYRTVRLDTLATRTASIRLYESLGWRPIEPWSRDDNEVTVAFELDL